MADTGEIVKRGVIKFVCEKKTDDPKLYRIERKMLKIYMVTIK